jgi:heme exporter protein D
MLQFWSWVSMGGYSLYVWPAYGVVVAVFLGLAVRTAIKKQRAYSAIKQWILKNERT